MIVLPLAPTRLPLTFLMPAFPFDSGSASADSSQKWLSLFEQIRLIFKWILRLSYIANFTLGIRSA